MEEVLKKYFLHEIKEKPDMKSAEIFSQSGYYWNSGIFAGKISVFLEEIRKYAPEIFKNLSGLALVFNFLYIRIYVFGDIIYVLYHYITWKGVIDSFLIIFLSIIYLMHINWAILLVQKMFALFMGTSIYDTREYKVKERESKQKISKKI